MSPPDPSCTWPRSREREDEERGCTVVLKLNSGFQDIQDAAVIRQKKHIFVENPVESLLLLDPDGRLCVLSRDGAAAAAAAAAERRPTTEPQPPTTSDRRRSTLSTIVSTSSSSAGRSNNKCRSSANAAGQAEAPRRERPKCLQPLDIEDKILQRKEMVHLFQWYYPEGGWGWVVLIAAMLCQSLGHGIWHLGHAFPFALAVRKRFSLFDNATLENGLEIQSNHQLQLGRPVRSRPLNPSYKDRNNFINKPVKRYDQNYDPIKM